MKNKAFTLVELLGVIVLLGILGVVIIPKVGDSITNSKETAYITQEEQIKKAAYDFIVDNIELFDNTNTITIKLGVLKQKGYLPINIKNPKTRKNISNESTITITKTNDKFEITLNLIDLIEVTESIDNNSPIIVLNGNYVEYINVNSNETEINSNLIENGAKAYSSTGEELTNITTQIKINEEEKTSIKTNALDTYEITYTVTDNGKTISSTRTVIIRDTEAPQIAFQKETNLHVSEVETLDLKKDLIITDNYDSNPTLTINSTLANRAGNYVVTYTLIDSSGNQTTERRVINVNDDWSKYYTNVEYIQSTGTQYIMTDIIPNDTMGVFAKISSQNTLNDLIYLGSKRNGDSRFWIGNIFEHVYYGWNTIPTANEENRPSITLNAISEIKMNYLNERNEYFNNRLTTSSLETLMTNNAPISIFAGNAAGTVKFNSKIRLYELKISEGNEIKYNLIPCYRNSDKELGLYDLENNKFYTNSGTGKFKSKELKDSFNNYERLSYIQSTGDQYIITDIIPNNTMGIYVKLSSQNTNDDVIFLGSKGTADTRFFIGNYQTNKIYYGWNTYTVVSNMPTFELDTIYEIKMNYLNTRKNYLDEQLKESNLPILAENSNTISIFADNNSGIISTYKAKMKLYELKISEENEIKYDFVPCYRKIDGEAGLYDIINNVFYGNSGTGDFIKGE